MTLLVEFGLAGLVFTANGSVSIQEATLQGRVAYLAPPKSSLVTLFISRCSTGVIFLFALLHQEPAEGVRPVEGAARPAGGRQWRQRRWWAPAVGVGPTRRGRPTGRGQAAAAAQGPAGGPHAHPGGTQQAAGVAAASSATAAASGNAQVLKFVHIVSGGQTEAGRSKWTD